MQYSQTIWENLPMCIADKQVEWYKSLPEREKQLVRIHIDISFWFQTVAIDLSFLVLTVC